MYSTVIYLLLIISISTWTYHKHISDNKFNYLEIISNILLTIAIIIQLIFLIFFKKSFLISNNISKVILAIILLISACIFKAVNSKGKYHKFLKELSSQFLILAIMLFIDGNVVPLLN